MLELKWQDGFATKNESVDLQHHYFVDLINRISTTLRETDDRKLHKKLFLEIVKYADFHFTSEENIAFTCKLPGLQKHHERHAELLDELKHHIEDLLAGSYSADDFTSFLINWFTGHTVYEDKKFFQGE